MKKKPEPHFSFEFTGVSDRLRDSLFTITDHQENREFRANVFVNDRDFSKLSGLCVEERIADVIDLAVAIHEADRWSQRHPEYPSRINVKLPIRNPDLYSEPAITRMLEKMLFRFTGDTWLFEFVPLSKQKRVAERQHHLWQSSNTDVETEVALFSGGADSLSGLLNQIHENVANRFLLFGAGGNLSVRGLQKRVFKLLKTRLAAADINLTQLHIHQRTRNFGLHPDKSLRARGIVFMFLGAAYAQLEGLNRLTLYENGIGAINLPFRASEVGIDHAMSVHPLSLHYVSEFLSKVFARPFVVHNPFLWWTKAEMFHVLKEMNISDIAYQSVSCDRLHRKSTAQCGRCSSCLLRREGFLAAGIPDKTPYLVDIAFGNELNRLLRTSHLPHMMYQVHYLQNIVANEDWIGLARQHPSRVVDMVELLGYKENDKEAWVNNIMSLYRRYTAEWNQVDVTIPFNTEIERIKRVPREAKKLASTSPEGN